MSEQIKQALEQIQMIMAGRTKEEACAIMCAVSALQGFYEQAQQFARQAQTHRDNVCRADAESVQQ